MTDPLFALTVSDAVKRVKRYDRKTQVFINTRLDEALRDEKNLNKQAKASKLFNLPYSLKDEWETKILPTTAGSWRHRKRRGAVNCKAYELFKKAGAVLLGKSNLSDLGIPPEASSYVGGSTKNPFDSRRTAGGSSGGSAAAVAFGYSAFEWGADIGGSIRLPAAFCGILGMRLSSQTWPITDFFPKNPPSLEWMNGQGPFTHSTDQMRAVLDVAAPMRTGTERAFKLKGCVLYEPDHGQWTSFLRDVQPHAQFAVDGPVLKKSKKLLKMTRVHDHYAAIWGSNFEELLQSDKSIDFNTGLRAAVSGLLFKGRLGDKRIHPLTAELLLLMIVGRYTLFTNRKTAMRRADAIRDGFRDLWDQGYLVIAPVCCFPPPKIMQTNRNTDIISGTTPGNIADATALAVPFGQFHVKGKALPRSLQIMGPPGSERLVLDVADRLIQSRDKVEELRPLKTPAQRFLESKK
ncbi:MAG: amidase family protein [Planctomycetota bacterium]|nr:amidase family protein [Planctomycetota bacterium]